MKTDNLSPLAIITAWGTMEELQDYLRNATQTSVGLENELIPEEQLRDVMDFLGVNPVFSEGSITLHGNGDGLSELERRRIEDYLRRTLEL